MSARTIADMFEHRMPTEGIKTHAAIASDRHVGIEVEVENAYHAESATYWDVIGDGSLRNDGREIVLSAPLAGNRLNLAYGKLEGILSSCPAAHCSERTSLHVHVDVRDLTVREVQNVLFTYVATESALYKMGGKNRYDNIYCPGVTAALEQIPLMRRALLSSEAGFQAASYSWCKYTGINLKSVHERGSIEFRAHEGTVNIHRIRTWVNILLTLVEYARNKEGLDAIMEDVKLGAEPLLRKVYGRFSDLLLEDGEYLQYYKNNMINLYDILNEGEFEFERVAQAAPAPRGDLDDVLNSLRNLVQGAA